MAGHLLDDDTFALWRFDEEANGSYLSILDSSGNARHAVAATYAKAARITNGKNGNRYARIFDGSDDEHIYNGVLGALTSTFQGSYIVSFFIRIDALPAAGHRGIIFSYGGATENAVDNDQASLAIKEDGHIVFRSEYGAGNSDDIAITSTPPSVGVWHHVALVRPPAPDQLSLLIYVDGAINGGGAWPLVPPPQVPDGGSTAFLTLGGSRTIALADPCAATLKDFHILSNARPFGATLTDYIVALASYRDTTMQTPLDAPNSKVLYRMNEAPDASDEAARGLHMASFAEGSTTPGVYPIIALGHCRWFDGSANASMLAPWAGDPNNVALNNLLKGSCCVEMWYRVRDSYAATAGLFTMGVVAGGSADNNLVAAELSIAALNDIRWRSERGAGVQDDYQVALMTVQEAASAVHLAINKTSSGGSYVLTLYVNGVLRATSGAITEHDGGLLNVWSIGKGIGGAAQFFGCIDDMRISTRPRTPAEIAESAERGQVTVEPPVVAPTTTPSATVVGISVGGVGMGVD